MQITFLIPGVPPDERGVSRSSRTRGGMRWTRMALETRAPDADGEVVWSWRLDAGVKLLRSTLLGVRVAKKPIARESTK
jgi:hypothetical protein